MISELNRSMAVALSAIVLAAVLVNGSSASPAGNIQSSQEEAEQRTADRPTPTETRKRSARSPQFAVYAESNADTLANLLPGGKITFSPLSVVIWRNYIGSDHGSALPDPGTAYVKSLSSDGKGGFRVNFVIDGNESRSHLPASLFSADIFRGSALDNRLVPYSLWSWTDSFDADPDEPAATDRTDGASYYDYFDINGWQAGGAIVGNFRGFMTYGVRTLPQNLPPGSATYEGILQAEVWSADNWQWGSRTSLEGNIRLEVNFDEGAFTGRVDELRVRVRGARGFEPLPEGNSFDIANSSIDEARMVTEWVGVDPNGGVALLETIRGFKGTLAGEFYGPTADELGGVLSGRLAPTSMSPEQFVVGTFGSSLHSSGD